MRTRSRKAMVMVLEMASFGVVLISVFGVAIKSLWNWLMPTIFGLAAITFWQALGLAALSWLLFGGWRGMLQRGTHLSSPRSARVAERLERMTTEEEKPVRVRRRPQPARG